MRCIVERDCGGNVARRGKDTQVSGQFSGDGKDLPTPEVEYLRLRQRFRTQGGTLWDFDFQG
jgi:hypothetical protein